jgi:adenosine deaminase
MIISVNTDDPTMFGTTLEKEYELLVEECGFTKDEICELILLGIESSWLSEDQKKLLATSFGQESSWMG